MTRYKVITGTITYAIKGRDVLRKNGFKAELIRTVNAAGSVGCGYGISTNCDEETIIDLFNRYGIKYLKISQV
jgi:hypothetical protein